MGSGEADGSGAETEPEEHSGDGRWGNDGADEQPETGAVGWEINFYGM